jgi:hypothetical protein
MALVPYAVGEESVHMLHYARDFVVVEEERRVKIFSYAKKYATPPITDIDLEKGDLLFVSYDPGEEKEGWCTAKIESEDNGNDVRYSCHRNREGQLDGKASGEFPRAKALLFRRAYIDKLPIPKPHGGPFKSVVVTHATREPTALVGKYLRTSQRQGGKPVYSKIDVAQFASVTLLWRSPTGLWVFGKKSQMDSLPEKGFAVAANATSMPHFVHEFIMAGLKAQIYTYSVKDIGEDESDSGDESDESVESSSGGEGGTGGGGKGGGRESSGMKRAVTACSKPAKRHSAAGAGGAGVR